MSSLMAMDECPSISLTICGWTPLISSRVAQVCLRSWNFVSSSATDAARPGWALRINLTPVAGRRSQSPCRLPSPTTWPETPRLTLSQLACTHAHETLLWASKGRGARHTFNHDLINGPNPAAQVSSVWRIPPPPRRERPHGYHPTQKPLRLVRRACSPAPGRGISSSTLSAGRGRRPWRRRS